MNFPSFFVSTGSTRATVSYTMDLPISASSSYSNSLHLIYMFIYIDPLPLLSLFLLKIAIIFADDVIIAL